MLPRINPQADVTSPYYVDPSDGPSSVKVTPILEGSNYHSWARALGGKMKLEFVSGTILVPADDFDLSYRAWNMCNMLIDSWLVNYVSESIAQLIVFLENVVDALNGLKERFSQGDLV